MNENKKSLIEIGFVPLTKRCNICKETLLFNRETKKEVCVNYCEVRLR